MISVQLHDPCLNLTLKVKQTHSHTLYVTYGSRLAHQSCRHSHPLCHSATRMGCTYHSYIQTTGDREEEEKMTQKW